MKTYTIRIELLNWWHAGSGEAGPGDLDATVVRDDDGLPYLPGKTLKGLFRDAALLVTRAQPGFLDKDGVEKLFGPAIDPGFQRPEGDLLEGALSFSSARALGEVRNWIRAGNQRYTDGLYESLASTAMKDGIAKAHSLRRIEVALPMVLEGEVEWDDSVFGDMDTEKVLRTCSKLIRRLGSHRHRGLGRSQVSIKQKEAEVPS